MRSCSLLIKVIEVLYILTVLYSDYIIVTQEVLKFLFHRCGSVKFVAIDWCAWGVMTAVTSVAQGCLADVL